MEHLTQYFTLTHLMNWLSNSVWDANLAAFVILFVGLVLWELRKERKLRKEQNAQGEVV